MKNNVEIAKLKLSSPFGNNLLNHFRIKKFADGNVFISVKNGWDRERDKERSCCIVLSKEQQKLLMEFLK